MLPEAVPVPRRRVEWSEERLPEGGTLVRLRFPPPDAVMSGAGWLSGAGGGPDGDLVRRIQEGDIRAEEELVSRFGEGLAFLLRRWTRDPAAAEDLYQETFRLALEKIRRGEVRDPERLAGFLRSLARNLSTEHYRRDARRGTREEDLETAGDLSLPETGQLAQVLREEKAALVRQVLEELGSERDRQVLFRFYIAEEDKESLRTGLGLSPSELNLVLFRARRRYRDLYERRVRQGSPRE